MTPEFIYADGGRQEAGRKGRTGDCVVRAICNTSGLPYHEVYDRLAEGNLTQRKTRRSRASCNRRSASNGISVKRKWFQDYLKGLGYVWTPTMKIGSGCKVHVRPDELPATGAHILSLSKHYSAWVDGKLLDTYDCSRGGTRCVYGYWTYKGEGS